MCLICLQFLEDRMVREEVKYALRELREEDDHTLNLKTLIEEDQLTDGEVKDAIHRLD